jgi:H+-transporting ATPase
MPFIIDSDGKDGPNISQLVRRSIEFTRQNSGETVSAGATQREAARAGRRMSQDSRHSHDSGTTNIVRRMSLEVTRVSLDVQRRRKKDAEDTASTEGTKDSTQPGGPAPADDHEEGGDAKKDFEQAPHDGLTTLQAEQLLKQWGKNELPEKVTPKWLIFLRLLTGPMPIMLWIAAIIEAVIGNYADMGILLAIQFTNAFISFYETNKAGDAVAALKKSLKPTATCKRNGKWEDIDATILVPGDLVLLAAGSAVPADTYVNEGLIEVDQSAMTGESLPVKFRRGDVCKLGSNVVRGETEGTVETTGANTFFGKTASMLQAVGNDGGSLQILLMRIMLILVSLSLSLCITALIYLIIEGRKSNNLRPESHRKEDHEIVKESLSFAVVVLVASIPLAIEIVTTTTLALGSKQLSAKGAIVTRLGAIEEMAGMDMLCSDKTGTLTLNKMVIQTDCPIYTPGETYESVLFQAALAAKWKEPPRDALDTMVLKTSGQDLSKCDAYTQLDFTPFDPRTKRTEGKLQGPDGKIFRITKGAPHVILGEIFFRTNIICIVY